MAVLAQKPPMGWNSWNTFGAHINEQLIMEMADTMVAEGYKEAGYEYVIIDDCWSLKERVDGKLVADPELFPHGMKALADYSACTPAPVRKPVQDTREAMVMKQKMQSSLPNGTWIT